MSYFLEEMAKSITEGKKLNQALPGGGGV